MYRAVVLSAEPNYGTFGIGMLSIMIGLIIFIGHGTRK